MKIILKLNEKMHVLVIHVLKKNNGHLNFISVVLSTAHYSLLLLATEHKHWIYCGLRVHHDYS